MIAISELMKNDANEALRRVLIVDDDEHDQQIIAVKLNNLHAAIDMASSLETAYQLARDVPPNVIILDVGIPIRQNGPVANMEDVLAFVRFHRDHHCLVVITGSADARESDIAQFYGAGAMDYIGKEKLMVELELQQRIRDAHYLYRLFKENLKFAQFAVQVSLMRSQQDRLFIGMRQLREGVNRVRESEITLIRQQAFKAGEESGTKKAETAMLEAKRALLFKRMAAWGAVTGAIATAWSYAWPFLRGFFHAKDVLK